MHDSTPAYGLWSLVIINSLIFIIFAFSFAKPQSPRDWRSFGCAAQIFEPRSPRRSKKACGIMIS